MMNKELRNAYLKALNIPIWCLRNTEANESESIEIAENIPHKQQANPDTQTNKKSIQFIWNFTSFCYIC